MRQLSVKQKKMLREWFANNKDKVTLAFNIQYDDFPSDLYEQIAAVNDHETIVQNINRFLTDMAAEAIHF